MREESSEISKIRASVHQRCGSKVVVRLDRGRNRVDFQSGTIQNAYPSVFTILMDSPDGETPPQLLSFNYSDIITQDIRMKLC